jgi:16S rRNA C967 or C1407 C5-methylase (RsmB/RsmF family)
MKQEEIDFSEQIKEARSEAGAERVADQQEEDAIEEKVKANLEKYGIDITTSFYDNDPKPVLDELKQVLISWEEKDYPDDETQWKAYFEDILTLVHRRTYNSRHDG